MSNDLAKFINSKRRHKTDVAIQEKRLFQNVEVIRDTHSNGLTTKEDDE